MGKDGTLREGVDIQWPGAVDSQNTDDSDSGLGILVNEILTSKGWCLMQMPINEEVRQGAVSQAEQLTFERQKVEFIPDLLGKNGSGKVCHLQPDDAMAFFASYDESITKLCGLIEPWALHTMGFKVDSRTQGMVWKQFSSKQEEKTMRPLPLDDDDVEFDLIESHLHFIQRRKLCCMYFLNSDGGKIYLHSKSNDRPTVELAVSSDLLLVFCCDEMMFEHAPDGDFTIYQTWILDEPLEHSFQGVLANFTRKDALQGITKGVGTPLGPRIMVQALETAIGGSGNSTLDTWQVFANGTDGLVHVPTTRFDTDVYFQKDFESGVTSYQVHGGLCDDARLFDFDHKFFNIEDQHAACVWPKQRLVLEVGYSCLAQAGYDKQSLNGRNIGCFTGDTGGSWLCTVMNQIRPPSCDLSDFTMSTTASRLAFTFGMKGPGISVDTACSSGLVSFSVAATSMRNSTLGQFSTFSSSVPLEGCIAGGICCTTDAERYVAYSAASMLSHKGRCFTFNTSADGYVRGEGCTFLFSRLCHDEAEKDPMIACAIGVCANQDGRSATLTAPNGPAQTACTLASLEEGNISSGEVSASECHGTGTALGDPIEVGALISVHGKSRGVVPLGMTSTKTNVGHMEDNAGAGGMFKCILMARFAVCSPNCHMRTMNSNLEHSGFPALFETENIDANVNSVISGVSSFGFGGANAHAEFWSRSTIGSHKTIADIHLESYDQLTITCPVTMGQIDYLTGEPAVDFEFEAPARVKAGTLRDALADYRISRHAYQGGFRFRASHDEEAKNDELESLPAVDVCGSWSGWAHTDPMNEAGEGIYTATVILGHTRCEWFYFCANGNRASRIYPVVNGASPNIEVKGPNEDVMGRCWKIDGRDLETPEGTAFKIYFKWGKFHKTVFWEQQPLNRMTKTVSSISTHTYSLAGSWNSYRLQDLTPSPVVSNMWSGCFKISERGREYFRILRDHCYYQIIYPSEPNPTSTKVPVRGPDDWGAGKYWLVEGKVDEIVPVQLEVNDGSFKVVIGSQVWESVQGWGRHDYFLKSWIDRTCVKMSMSEPGIFKCVGVISHDYRYEHKGYVDFFQVLVDADPNHCFYPAMPNARSGMQITHPPYGQNPGHSWVISSLKPGVNYEVILDLTVKDRRKMVTCRLL